MPRRNRGPYLSDKPNQDGHYEIRWSEHGRSRRRSTRSGDPVFAGQILANFILGFDRQASRPVARLTVAKALADYWDEHVRHNVLSIQTAAYALRELARGFAGYDTEFNVKKADTYFEGLAVHADRKLLSDITVADVRKYTADRGVAAGSIRRELVMLVAAGNHAARQKRIEGSDLPHIPLPPPPAPVDRWLTDGETGRLLHAAAHAEGYQDGRLTRAYRFIALARYTAARRRAIETLTWAQVDLQRRTIRYNPEGRRQSRKKRPAVPIADVLYPVLVRAFEEKTGDFVLDHQGSIRATFETTVWNAGLEGVTPHVLRHTWATRAAQEGVPLVDVAGMLGDEVATVVKNYLHHCPEHLRGAANAGHDRGITPAWAPPVSGIDRFCHTPDTENQ
jgi:integrase